MTDEPPSPSDSHSPGSYRVCEACQCQYHTSQDSCPECGAFPGETIPPSADAKINLTLTLALGGILALCLFALSRDREEAAALEQEAFSRLDTQMTDSEPEPPPGSSSTPTPFPTATPVPRPTPIPFHPNDFNPVPPAQTPTPDTPPVTTPPVTTPPVTSPPISPPTATPVPETTRPSTLELKAQIAEKLRKDLNEQLPLAKQGDFIRLTLRNNRTISGTIIRLDHDQVGIQSTRGSLFLPYRELSTRSRMQVDQSERDTWVEEQALKEVLKSLE